MSDLISRKALIAEYDRVHVGPPGGARKLMEEAPAVEPYGTWIPCSKRLPEVEGSYMTTTEYGAVRVNHFYTRSNTWGYKSNKTIAWMPLPEPWKGEKR